VLRDGQSLTAPSESHARFRDKRGRSTSYMSESTQNRAPCYEFGESDMEDAPAGALISPSCCNCRVKFE